MFDTPFMIPVVANVCWAVVSILLAKIVTDSHQRHTLPDGIDRLRNQDH